MTQTKEVPPPSATTIPTARPPCRCWQSPSNFATARLFRQSTLPLPFSIAGFVAHLRSLRPSPLPTCLLQRPTSSVAASVLRVTLHLFSRSCKNEGRLRLPLVFCVHRFVIGFEVVVLLLLFRCWHFSLVWPLHCCFVLLPNRLAVCNPHSAVFVWTIVTRLRYSERMSFQLSFVFGFDIVTSFIHHLTNNFSFTCNSLSPILFCCTFCSAPFGIIY